MVGGDAGGLFFLVVLFDIIVGQVGPVEHEEKYEGIDGDADEGK